MYVLFYVCKPFRSFNIRIMNYYTDYRALSFALGHTDATDVYQKANRTQYSE